MRRAIYPGTFDPITNGHLDIIRRAQRLFDELVIAIAANPQKAPLLDHATRERLVRTSVEGMKGTRVVAFDGLLVGLVEDYQADVILRGLRAVSDFEFEFQMALMNRELSAKAETIYLMPSVEHIFVSSTIIKNIAGHGGPIRKFVPPHVEEALMVRFAGDRPRA
jgi:pantetheine-phosphate adenylyltransferase